MHAIHFKILNVHLVLFRIATWLICKQALSCCIVYILYTVNSEVFFSVMYFGVHSFLNYMDSLCYLVCFWSLQVSLCKDTLIYLGKNLAENSVENHPFQSDGLFDGYSKQWQNVKDKWGIFNFMINVINHTKGCN